MADIMNAVCLHFVWATWDRLPTLTPERRVIVYEEIVTQSEKCGCSIICIGGIADHVHILVRFASTVTMSDLVKQMKGGSSRAINRHLTATGIDPTF